MDDFERDLELRSSFKYQILGNPNYFGNLSDLGLKDVGEPVLKKVSDTTYEELTCIGYNPDNAIVVGIVEIKQGGGYSGGPCTDGSKEYVRFYFDYGSGWVDHGVASFTAHDLQFSEDLCYAVPLRIKPRKTSCCDRKPVLPRVRAILSWNVEPPANTPNWLPVWGNRLEHSVQIEPRNPIFCKIFDGLELPDIQVIDPIAVTKLKELMDAQPKAPKPKADMLKLKLGEVGGKGREADIELLRTAFPVVSKLAQNKFDLGAATAFKPFDVDLTPFEDFILKPAFNTTYEELHCVGLDRDQSLLHGVVQIKRNSGYSGDLCTDGSREYIAFYLDFGSGWEYQGTTLVEVHDIADIPDDGLWYQASLPVNLDKHRQVWCETGRARIRGILSWDTPPPPHQPEFVAHWGDREDCWIEIKPLPEGVLEGVETPFIEAIGNMPVAQIAGTGYANGDSIGGTFTADDSPFGGRILIAGLVAFPSSNNLEYQVMIQGPSDPAPVPFTKTFDVSVTTVIGSTLTTGPVTQTAVGGWYDYIPQAGPPIFKSVAGNLLAPFNATEEGLHTVYVSVREKGTIAATSSATVAFMVDNTAPTADVEITSGGGNCSKFQIGEVLVGTYAMSDLHSRSLSLTVTPSAEAAGGHLAIPTRFPAAPLPPPLPGPTASNSLSYGALTLHTSGASGSWELDTTGMDPCGYNIRLHAEDRTIVNSGGIGWERVDIEGFCLE